MEKGQSKGGWGGEEGVAFFFFFSGWFAAVPWSLKNLFFWGLVGV